MISAAVDAQLDAQGLQFLQDIGIETASDLANLWTSEYQILEATSEASLLQQLTRAWQAASVQESIRLVPAATLVHVPSVPQGAKPKNRAVPPASLLPAAYRFRIKPAVVANPLQVADKRAPLLDLMFELALAPGSENIVFGKDVVAYQLEAKPIFERKLQTVQTDALDAHKRALKRCIAYHAQHCPAEMPYWRPDAMHLSAFLQHVSSRVSHSSSWSVHVAKVDEREDRIAFARAGRLGPALVHCGREPLLQAAAASTSAGIPCLAEGSSGPEGPSEVSSGMDLFAPRCMLAIQTCAALI